VSGWARPARRAVHNQAYWDCRPVYGAGAGAHSYATDGDTAWRWWNVARPREYIAAALGGGAVESDREELEPSRARAERVMLGLRTTAGLVPPAGLEAPLRALLDAGLVVRRGARYAPTRRGLDLHNRIALEVL
jgi:oxygen-independent coproporphyrinogen III oxidase